MNGARHLGGNGSQRLALEIGVVAIPGNVTLVFGPEAIVALADGDVGGHPEGASQSRVAKLRKHGATAELSGLVGGEIETAELKELAMVTEPAHATDFGEDGHGVDRADAWHLAQLSEAPFRKLASACPHREVFCIAANMSIWHSLMRFSMSPRHLLKVLLDDAEGLAAGLIDRAGGDSRAALAAVEAALAKRPKVSGGGAGRFISTRRSRASFTGIYDCATRRGHLQLSTWRADRHGRGQLPFMQ